MVQEIFIQKPQVWELSRFCPETATKLYVHEFSVWSVSRSWIHERAISLRFLGILLRVVGFLRILCTVFSGMPICTKRFVKSRAMILTYFMILARKPNLHTCKLQPKSEIRNSAFSFFETKAANANPEFLEKIVKICSPFKGTWQHI